MTTKIPVELSSTPGIADSSNATAITIDSSEHVTLSGDLLLADSKKIKLGAGSDLNLYHDGSDSYITDTGTGNLLIQYSDLYFSKDAGSTHSVVFRSTGRVGIGTTSPDQTLTVSSASGIAAKFLGEDGPHGLNIGGNDGGFGYIGHVSSGSYDISIDSSGNVGIGYTSPASFFAGAANLVIGGGSGDEGTTIFSGNSSLGRIHFADGTTGNDIYAGFIAYDHSENDLLLGGRGSGTTILTLEANGSVGAPSGTNIYNASDRRVKENITTLSDSLAIVKDLNPVKFNWIKDFSKSENDKTLYGFVAQEVQSVFPDAVESFASGTTVTAGDVTVENPLAVREKFLIPVLVKAIQEQQTIIDDLEARVKTLEG